jgi:hypothetical protein
MKLDYEIHELNMANNRLLTQHTINQCKQAATSQQTPTQSKMNKQNLT